MLLEKKKQIKGDSSTGGRHLLYETDSLSPQPNFKPYKNSIHAYLPPEAVLLIEHHEDVTSPEAKSSILRGDEAVLARIEVKVSSEVDLSQPGCLLVAGLHLDHQGTRAITLQGRKVGRKRERERERVLEEKRKGHTNQDTPGLC